MTVHLLQNASTDDVICVLSEFLTQGIISPSVRQMAEGVAKKQDRIAAVYDLVRDTFPYLPDPYGFELFVHPNRVATDFLSGRTRSLDCDDMALLNAALLGSIGYRVEVLLLGNPDLSHAVCRVYSTILGEWVMVDSTGNLPLGWDMSRMYSRRISVKQNWHPSQ